MNKPGVKVTAGEAAPAASGPLLKRALGLPLLVFYGLGVTVGAGIFALIGKILGLAGDHAPLAFLIAGVTAAVTARAFALLARRYPKAAGEAIYASEAFGAAAGRIAGLGVGLTAVVSSAVVSLAFAGYVGTLVAIPAPVIVVALLAATGAIAIIGIRESVVFASLITILEVGTLAVIAVAGLPTLLDLTLWERLLVFPADRVALDVTVAASAIAFFAFIGFEDIVNMAEETRSPERTLGPAIAITLVVSVALYVAIAAAATAVPGREAIVASNAPLADLFALLTGLPAAPIAVIAAIAMINGVLVQVLMASRVIYGMAREGLLPRALGIVAPRRQTPVVATLLVTSLIAALALVAPMVGLAQTTGYITLGVFALVNLSLFRIAGRPDWPGGTRDRWWGLVGAGLALALLGYEAVRQLS